MKRVCFVCCAAVALLYACGPAAAGLPVKKTEKKIARSLEDKAAAVGVAVLTDGGDVLLHNGRAPLPLMSVFKFHVALCVLDKMDRNRTDPDSLVFVEAYRLRPGTYSPLRERASGRDTVVSLRELLGYSVSQSDNNACDILIEYAGGIARVESYIKGLGSEASLSATEELMCRDIENQRLNRSSALDLVRLMKRVRDEPPFDPAYRDLLWVLMFATVTGDDKLKGGLPAGMPVAHKTGSSDRTLQGVKIADNDAGYVVLPDGSGYYIAVFVTDSQETDRTNADIIARISEIVYDAMVRK